MLVFLTLTGIPIMLTPFIAHARGDTPVWGVLAPLAVVTVAILIRLLSAAHLPTRG